MSHWNVVLVKKFTYPMPKPLEFSVEAESFQEAYPLILEKFKEQYEEKKWKIQSIYFLDPKWMKKEE